MIFGAIVAKHRDGRTPDDPVSMTNSRSAFSCKRFCEIAENGKALRDTEAPRNSRKRQTRARIGANHVR